jgi:hypothetical protein
MKIVTTSNLKYDNNDLYDDGRTFDGVLPEDSEMDNPFMAGSNQARLINLTSSQAATACVLVAATTQIYPNPETDNYYKSKG